MKEKERERERCVYLVNSANFLKTENDVARFDFFRSFNTFHKLHVLRLFFKKILH